MPKSWKGFNDDDYYDDDGDGGGDDDNNKNNGVSIDREGVSAAER